MRNALVKKKVTAHVIFMSKKKDTAQGILVDNMWTTAYFQFSDNIFYGFSRDLVWDMRTLAFSMLYKSPP